MANLVEDIRQLREETSCGVIECKKALEESKGDFQKAKDILRKRGLEMAAIGMGAAIAGYLIGAALGVTIV